MEIRHSTNGLLTLTTRRGLVELVREVVGCSAGDEVHVLYRLPAHRLAVLEDLAVSSDPEDEAAARDLLRRALADIEALRQLRRQRPALCAA